ncbi:hypothetical protein HYFRA_00002602 [Hymenoscyphus fraxineus]|uniref:Uncharacterized protein n=1 Tax=Hymenoscyphus fraxineus TaxID=746836 RepID=A0A9N9L641_9HELO|nr:hypothetical protein HYFRA_00002602 [Hymenoscyphus fraxineus]
MSSADYVASLCSHGNVMPKKGGVGQDLKTPREIEIALDERFRQQLGHNLTFLIKWGSWHVQLTLAAIGRGALGNERIRLGRTVSFVILLLYSRFIELFPGVSYTTPKHSRRILGNAIVHKAESHTLKTVVQHQFITESVNSLSTRNKIYDDQSASGDSTTLWRSFKRNGNYLQTPFQVGLKHLTGCTSVVIIGHGGIWASHIFEDSGMDPANKAYAEKLMLSGSKKFDVFSNHFSELNGSPKSGPGYLPEVFIINPTKTRGGSPVPYDPTTPRDDTSSDELGYDESQQEYQREYGVISRVIRGHWPQIIIREHRYHALNSDNTSDKDRLENSAAGRILFEYDAKAGGPFEIRLHLENYEFLRTVLPPI